MNRGRLSGDRTSANGRRSLFFPSFVSSFAFLSRVRDLETADRVRCNYPPSGRRGRSVPWSVRSFVRPGLCREVNASRVCSPIGRQRAGGEHSVHSSSDSHTAFPIPRADGHRQSETSHEILHGENLRVPAAFPLIRTRGNRPFRSRGERGPRATRCNNIVVVCIDSFTLFSPFFIPSSSRAPFPPVLVRFMRFSRFFHTTRLLCRSHPFALPLSLLTLSLSLSLSVSLSLPHPCPWTRSYLMYSTPPSSAGRTLVRLVFDALTTRYFRVDLRASLIPTTSYIYVPVVPWSTATREFASRLDPTGWDLRTCRAPRKTFLQARWEPWTEGIYTFTWTPRWVSRVIIDVALSQVVD